MFNRRGFFVSALALNSLAFGCSKTENNNGVLRVAMAGAPDSLDPLKAEFASAALIFRQIYKPLIGYGDNGTNIAAVFKSWKSSDNQNWEFVFDNSLKWSDGTAITINDVIETFKLASLRETAFPDAPEFSNIIGFAENIKGNKIPLGISVSGDIIKIGLINKDANFPNRLREFYPLPIQAIKANASNWTDMDKIVVSAAFKPSLRTQTRLVLEASPNTGWNANMPKSINIEAVDDGATRVRMFKGHQVDLAQDPPMNLQKLLKTQLDKSFDSKFLQKLFYVSVNTKNPKLSNTEIRRAIGLLINRQFICETILNGAVKPAYDIINKANSPDANALKLAQDLLVKNGVNPQNPLVIELLCVRDERERAAIQIQSDLKPLGIEITINAGEASAISARLNGHDFELAIAKIDKGLKTDPIDLLKSFASDGNAYSHGWKDSKYDDAIKNAMSIGSEQSLKQAESILLDAMPIIPLWFAPMVWLIDEKLNNNIQNMPPIFWDKLSFNQ